MRPDPERSGLFFVGRQSLRTMEAKNRFSVTDLSIDRLSDTLLIIKNKVRDFSKK